MIQHPCANINIWWRIGRLGIDAIKNCERRGIAPYSLDLFFCPFLLCSGFFSCLQTLSRAYPMLRECTQLTTDVSAARTERLNQPYLPSTGFVDGTLPSFHKIEVDVEPPICCLLWLHRDLSNDFFVQFGEAEPEQQEHRKYSQNDWLQDGNTSCLSKRTDGEGQNRCSSSTKCGCEADCRDMEIRW